MRFWAHDQATFPLPDGHKFPLAKYRLLRERLLAEGLATQDAIRFSEPAPWERLALVHQDAYLERVRDGRLSDREQRVLGLPWSAELVDRGRRSTQSTVEAVRDALLTGRGMNLGGGTHHAGRASGRGFCLFNDIAVAIHTVRAEQAGAPRTSADAAAEPGLADGRTADSEAPGQRGFGEPRQLGRVAVIDCDVHQGDGTAELLHPDPDVFTCSLHGGKNYPFRRATSDLDVELASGLTDDGYLAELERALDVVEAWDSSPALVIYLAGADPWEGDRLGRLALTKDGLGARDRLVLDRAAQWGSAVCVALAGGYAPDLTDTVDINTQTVRELLARGDLERDPAPT